MKKMFFMTCMSLVVIVIGYSIFSYTTLSMGRGLDSVQETIDIDDAETANVVIEMGLGKIIVNESKEYLMEGDFIYDNKTNKPKINYELKDKTGHLNISQKSRLPLITFNVFGPRDNQNDWDVKLNQQIPMDLQVVAGFGKAELSLKDLNLNKLDLETGVGETTIDLNGNWQKNVDVKMNTGIGKTKVILPENIGTKIKATKGIGSLSLDGFTKNGDHYVNQAYETSPVIINMSIDIGIGEVIVITQP